MTTFRSVPRFSRFRRFLFLLTVCSITSAFLLFYSHKSTSNAYSSSPRRKPPMPDYFCHNSSSVGNRIPINFVGKTSNTEPKILVLVETQFSPLGRQVTNLLVSLKFPYRVEVFSKNLPLLTTVTRGRFNLIFIENYYKYLNMDAWNRQLLDKYCKDYEVGIVSFMTSRVERNYQLAKVLGFPLKILQTQAIKSLSTASDSSVLHIAQAGKTLSEDSETEFQDDWLLFIPDHETFEPILLAERANLSTVPTRNVLPAAILDRGKFDGIRRIIFGYDFRSWLVPFLLPDSIRFLTDGRLALPLKRYLQIDIDDIFVGKSGYRMVQEDVEALIKAQMEFQKDVPGFKFNLGFSGKFYKAGNNEENKGDGYLLEHNSGFHWFPHMWRHNQPPKVNDSYLEEVMRRNLDFAQKHGLNIKWSYAVAPHHAGVYPVHEPLYSAWKRVWGIKMTSTEEYPHLKPAAHRRGFIHRDIMPKVLININQSDSANLVLPRQTCGLYTHTVMLDQYPEGGPARLRKSIFGGDLFFSFLLNPFLIFMTHQGNYAHDRLALYTFRLLLEFLKCWTNLELVGIPPLELGLRYFEAFPEEREPIWGNPCLDQRHLDIWSANKSCSNLPKAIVIGPQKTGTTALYSFLKMHPGLTSSKPSAKTFEEVQFFSGRNYRNGIDWYMKFFDAAEDSENGTRLQQHNNASDTSFFFEKSATYFDSDSAPKRIRALIPDVKLIAILLNPASRAYSWYQHEKAHGDPVALKYSFHDVISGDVEKGSELWRLRQRCLNPGMFAHHLDRWLEHFSSKQILLVDGEQLKEDPATVMDSVQTFLGVTPLLNYRPILKYDKEKGFFCQIVSLSNRTKTKCLGRGKGRVYEPMLDEDHRIISKLYLPHNIALHRLLKRLGYSTPDWLEEELGQDNQ